MKDVVSFEAAKRLKEAGFPQPEKQPGQIWYGTRYKGGTESYQLPFIFGNKLQTLRCSDGQFLDLDDHVFAPTATDILHSLYSGHSEGIEWSIVFRGKNWSCVKRQWTEQGQSVSAWYDADNPAEACAAAWLSIHRKTTNQ